MHGTFSGHVPKNPHRKRSSQNKHIPSAAQISRWEYGIIHNIEKPKAATNNPTPAPATLFATAPPVACAMVALALAEPEALPAPLATTVLVARVVGDVDVSTVDRLDVDVDVLEELPYQYPERLGRVGETG